MIVSTLKGCKTRRYLAQRSIAQIWHPFRVRSELLATGGLRFASTSGYSLTTLRVANTLSPMSQLYSYRFKGFRRPGKPWPFP
jgi:hypothetical protein